MYEFIKLTDNDFYIDCPAKIGIVQTKDGVYLIDSGIDKDTGKKVLRILNENGLELKAIINTHSHADHIGGNRYLQEKTGCKIYANGIESAFSNYPLLEAMCLHGGKPYKDITVKFLKAQESRVSLLESGVLPDGFKILELYGHSPQMAGIITPDGTAYIGDSVMSKNSLSKHKVSYQYDVGKALETLEYLKTVDAKRFVPAHAEVCDDIKPLADYNIAVINEIKDKVNELLTTPKTFENLLKEVCGFYNILLDPVQFALVGSTIRAYITCLYEENKITFEFKDNEMLWKKIL